MKDKHIWLLLLAIVLLYLLMGQSTVPSPDSGPLN